MIERYNVIGIIGNRGDGKTNLAVKFLYDYYTMGRPIIANIWLAPEYFDYIKLTLDMLLKLPESINHAVILIDELQKWADAYKFFSKDSLALSTLFTQLRKRKLTVIYTTQDFSTIAKRLRGQTDYIVEMKHLNAWDNKGNYVDGFSKATVHDARELEGRSLLLQFQHDGRPYFDMYDTNEVVLGREEMEEEELE